MQKILRIHSVLAVIFGLLLVVLMFVIVIDIGGRFFFLKPLPGGVEIARVLLAWIFFLPLAYALVTGAHVRVTVLLTRLPHRLSSIADGLGTIFSISFLSLAVYASWKQFWESFVVGETLPAPIWIPFWLAKLALPIGCSLITAQLIINLVVHFRQLARRN